jgi:hypothetical protein
MGRALLAGIIVTLEITTRMERSQLKISFRLQRTSDENGVSVKRIRFTPIAANIGANVNRYVIESAESQEGTWEQIGEIEQNAGIGEDRLGYEYHVNLEILRRWCRVVPYDSGGVAGIPSIVKLSPAYTEWSHSWGGEAFDYARGVAVDQSGNSYSAGLTTGYGAGLDDVLVLKYGPSGELAWAKTWGTENDDEGYAIAVDTSGDVYVAGRTRISLDRGWDALLLKYSPSGSLLWARTWGVDDDDWPQAVAVDQNGCAYMTGYHHGPGGNQIGIFLLKYSPDGDLVWQKTWGKKNVSLLTKGIAIDSDGNIIVVGDAFGIGPGINNVLILKYSPTGDLLWQRTWGGTGSVAGASVACDEYGNAYIAGVLRTGDPNNANDVLFLKVSTNGTLLVRKAWGQGYIDWADGIALGPHGQVYITGSTYSAIGGDNPLLIELSPGGELQRVLSWNALSSENGHGIATDSNGMVYIVGRTQISDGSWSALDIPLSTPEGSMYTPVGTETIPAGIEGIPDGIESQPTGIEDAGGGDTDALIIRVDPART